ncbi:MAG TPA: alpha/beta fold hydrolase, partial [Thermoanaerobaculia bacterium]|nr:alpha/beta fold hydrolase [Thermoanaerobaculia bacterium]
VSIPGAAHVAMWDTPSEFNSLALSFLSEAESLPLPALAPVFSWGLSGFTNGIAHRQCGTRRDIVLVHGLGMSSAYFVHLARELYARGFHPIAPDLPGFGESNNAPAAAPLVHAQWLASWADAAGIRNATWLGHSTGCNAVAHVASLRPDLVSRAVYVGPIWTRRSSLRIFAMLALDAFREPLSLYRYVLRAYWRAGLARWALTWLRHVADLRTRPHSGTFLAGTRDPLPDRTFVPVREVEGAHACVFSRAGAVASEVGTGAA